MIRSEAPRAPKPTPTAPRREGASAAAAPPAPRVAADRWDADEYIGRKLAQPSRFRSVEADAAAAPERPPAEPSPTPLVATAKAWAEGLAVVTAIGGALTGTAWLLAALLL